MNYLKFAIFAAILLSIECKPSAIDDGNGCIAGYLKRQGKLEEDFPITGTFKSSKCSLVMPLIMVTFERALNVRLSGKEEVNADCIMEELKKADALDYMLKQEVLLMSPGLDEEETKMRIENTKEKLRLVFESAAKTCESDPAYGGLFDDILEIRNESLAVLQQNYCFTKFAVDSKLIDLEDVDVNPKKISTSNVDCPEMIRNNRLEREKKLQTTLEKKNLSKDKIQCIKDKFQIDRAFDSNLALEVIDHLDVSLEDKRRNRENIAKKLEEFIKSIFVCSGFQVGNKTSSIDPISIVSM